MDGEVVPVSQWSIETPADEMRREIADLKAEMAELRAALSDLKARAVLAPPGWDVGCFQMKLNPTVTICRNTSTLMWGWGDANGWRHDVASTADKAAEMAERGAS